MNLSKHLKKALNNDFFAITNLIGKNADLYGINAYIIGGVVRDLLLEKPIYDIDIVIEGNAINFCYFLQKQNYGIISRKTNEFGTAKFKFNQFPNFEIDFASTRTESYPKAGHLPVIDKIGCSLKEDILRRDFKVNALALKINEKSYGELIDYTGGLYDIEKKELCTLHNQSFIDDPTRIIRGLRFAHKLNFILNEETKTLQQNYLDNFDNTDICYERIKQVTKLAFNLNSIKLIEDFIKNNIYKLLCSNPRKFNIKKLNIAILNNSSHLDKENIWLIYLASIITPKEATKLNLTNKEMLIIKSLDDLLTQNIDINNNLEIYNLYKNKPVESIIASIAFDKDNIAQKYLSELKNITPILKGKDLIKLGFSEGKIIGETLNKLLIEKLNGKLKTKDEEINFVKNLI